MKNTPKSLVALLGRAVLASALLCAVFCAVSFMYAPAVSAQACDTTALGACLANSGAACRNSLTGCGDTYSVGLSVPDVQDLATERCCAFATAKKQKKCFNGLINKLAGAQRQKSILKEFIKASRAGIIATRNAGCSTGSVQ